VKKDTDGTCDTGEFNASLRFFVSCLVGEIIVLLCLVVSRCNGLEGRLGPGCGGMVRSFLFGSINAR
jgi:hypothetical protein